ncbi:MAG: AMP-binding protein [Spirochaetales bacterium]|nr:AMP-binding protein [Spirochaetales bacterium]
MSEMIEKTIDQVFREVCARTPEKDFIIYSDKDLRWTYEIFNNRVNDLAKGFLAVGIGKGDHVGIWATNVPDWLTYLFATARIGAILVTINTNYKLHELEFLIKQSDLKALALIDGWRDSDYVAMIRELVPELSTCERDRLSSEKFPYLERVISMGDRKHRGMYTTHELMLMGSFQEDDEVMALGKMLDCHDVINMQYTSGTTGFPKGVQLTHYNILNNGYNIGQCQKFTSDEILCLPPPLFHCFGIVLGVMAILTHGATLVPIQNFDPLLVMASVQKEKCTALYGVPTMFIAELNHPMFDMFDFSSLRTGIMAGSPCPMDVMNQVVEKMNMRDVTIAYGLTEASPVMTQTRTDDSLEKRVSTVGPALPGIEVKVLNPETGEECPPEVQGELCCRGYNVMKGYYKMPEATAECIDKEGWLHSGDLGIMDGDGFFRVTGRIKDMIIRGGENIYPREIEEFLYPFEEIQDVQVAGVPDEKYGEQVGAFIILKEGKILSEEDVRERCIGQISRFKIPKYVFFVDSYPMTGSGKIQKYKMGELALELLKERESAL